MRTPAQREKIVGLLQSALERGGNCALHVEMASLAHKATNGRSAQGSVLMLLASHSTRWQTAKFVCPFPDLQHLSAVEGKLPALQELEINGWADAPNVLRIFRVAPQLTELRHAGSLEDVSRLPLEQLRHLKCLELRPHEIAGALSLIQRTIYKFSMELFIKNGLGQDLDLRPVSSYTTSLVISLAEAFRLTDCTEALLAIFANLTLPHLQYLGFESEEYPVYHLPWPHAAFLALASRSSFSTHLLHLQLSHITISEAELVECVAVLRSLQTLAISDHHPADSSFNRSSPHTNPEPLLTDSLLRHLEWTADEASLIPHLHTFRCDGRLRFNDAVLLDFVQSRMQSGRTNFGPFTMDLRWFSGDQRELQADIHASLCRLHARQEVVFLFSAADMNCRPQLRWYGIVLLCFNL